MHYTSTGKLQEQLSENPDAENLWRRPDEEEGGVNE